MSAVAQASVEDLLDELARREQRKGKIYELFPDEGPCRRELYQQHLRFFEAGNDFTARLAQCANGVGKSYSMGGYETALHLTGLYPDWWPGFRYTRPVRWWIAGDTRESTRKIQQQFLLGPVKAEDRGGGLIPADCIDFGSIMRRPQGNGAVDEVRIKNASGGWSVLSLKSYEQGVRAFFGDNIDGAWLDEPAPLPIFSETVARFRGSEHPMIMVTFTPKDMRADHLALLNKFHQEESDSRIVIQCAWEDVPHLSEEWKNATLDSHPSYMADTVSKGKLALGEGSVYPIPEEKFVIDPLPEIPQHWRRFTGFDAGWTHPTAVAWFAWDKDADVVYLYSEHKESKLAIPLHAAAIKARGDWIPIVGDAAATNQTDGKNVRGEYKQQGVRILQADKSVDAGTQAVLTRIITGRFKVYSTCTKWLHEYRTYHYDEKTHKIVKVNDDLMDATRYAIFSGLKHAKSAAEANVGNTPFVPETRFGRRY